MVRRNDSAEIMEETKVESKNLVLDLDGTLIDVQSSVGANSAIVLGRGAPSHICGREFGQLRIFKRPGLDAFLTWCFDNFDNVGIWTLSSREWLDEVLDNVLDQFPREKWSFLWTGERATRLQSTRGDTLTMGGVGIVKDLKKLYKNKMLKSKGFNRWNTLIIEDNPCNCIRNYGNAIYVSPFDVLGRNRDTELTYLQSYLSSKMLLCQNVRRSDKRHWLRETVEEERLAQINKAPKSESTAFWMQPDKWKAPTIINITTCSFRI